MEDLQRKIIFLVSQVDNECYLEYLYDLIKTLLN